MKATSGTQISRELSDRLDEAIAELPREHLEVLSLNLSDRLRTTYDLCIWYAGCYYCRQPDGTWKALYCYA